MPYRHRRELLSGLGVEACLQEARSHANVGQVLQHHLQRVRVLHLHRHHPIRRRALPPLRRQQLRLVHLQAQPAQAALQR